MKMPDPIINVAIAGLGRSGWDIHARTLRGMPERFRVVSALDASPERRTQAQTELGARTVETFDALIADPAVQLVVVATPNRLHAEQSIAALRAGKDVIVEKPMATSLAEVDQMIAAAKSSGRVLTVFQNMRFFDDFQKILEITRSGLLGRIVQVRLTMHRFTRRWDWQTLKEFGGGTFNNAAPHFLDIGMELFGETEPQVWAKAERTLTSGDAEDHVRIILHGPGAPTVEIEISHCSPYAQDAWHIMGTSGGLRGNHDALEWKWVDWSKLPPRPVDRSPAAAGREYAADRDLPWQTDSWKNPGGHGDSMSRYYASLYESLTQGKPPAVTAESVRRRIAVLDQARAMSETT
jgi:predicted dehydrogenase